MVQIWIHKNIKPQQTYKAADKVQILFQSYYDLWRKKADDGVRLHQKRAEFVQKITNNVFEISKMIDIVPYANEAEIPMQVELIPRAPSPTRALAQISGSSHIQVPIVHAEQQPNVNQIEEHEVNPLNFEVVNNMVDIIDNQPNRNLRIRNVIDERVEIKPDKDVCIMFDHIGLSHRQASLAFITMAKSFGADPANIVSSTSTMFRYRQTYRGIESANIKENFDITKMVTIHWDGKTFTSRGQVKDKKLAVVLSNSKEAKLLDIQTVANGTALTHTEAILNVIDDWNVQEHIISMCFDTESVNTGRISGVCVLLEDRLQRELLYLGCRHHIFEIFLSASFETTVEPAKDSDGPRIPIFEQFAKQYYQPHFNKRNYKNGREDEFFAKLIGVEGMDEIATFCRAKLTHAIERNE